MVILIIALFVLLILVHEFGHFIAARRNGVEVEEFGIGFPPKLYGYKPKDSDTEYTLNLLPLGGFVKLKGESSADTEPGSFGATRFLNKAKILLAGVGMNLLAAFVILTGLAFVGLPQFIENQYTIEADENVVRDEVIAATVTPTFPFAEAGLETGDVVEKIGDFTITDSGQLFELGDEFIGTEAEVVYTSDNESITRTIQFPDEERIPLLILKNLITETLEVDASVEIKSINDVIVTENNIAQILENNQGKEIEVTYTASADSTDEVTDIITIDTETTSDNLELAENSGPFGFGPADVVVKRYTWSAPLVGLGLTIQLTWLTLYGVLITFGQLFTGAIEQASQNVTGPIGIFVLLDRFTALGIQFVLYFMAVISVALAVMNVLPIPALDGGRLALTAGFKLAKKELTEEFESRVHTIGFMILLGLIALLSYVDINRFF